MKVSAYLTKLQLPVKFGLRKTERKKSGARAGGINSSSRSLSTSTYQKLMGIADRLLPCRSSKGFENSLWKEGDSLESEVPSLSVMKTKIRNPNEKRQSCCLVPTLLGFFCVLAEERACRKQSIAVKFPVVFCPSAAAFSLAL